MQDMAEVSCASKYLQSRKTTAVSLIFGQDKMFKLNFNEKQSPIKVNGIDCAVS